MSEPIISSIITTWGTVLNIAESSSDQTVTVHTTNAQDGQDITITLNSQIYNRNISDNSLVLTIPSADLQALTNGLHELTAEFTGNSASKVINYFTVDKTAPILTVIGLNPATVEKGAVYSDEGATSSGGESVSTLGSVDTSVVGSYILTYSASDNSGNAAIQVTRTVNVVDTTSPIITITGANPATVE